MDGPRATGSPLVLRDGWEGAMSFGWHQVVPFSIHMTICSMTFDGDQRRRRLHSELMHLV
jgi:hypothetical protein